MANTNSVFKSTVTVSGGCYVVSFSWVSWDPIHQQYIEEQGEPLVSLGGEFTYNTDQTFTLPERDVRLRSGFPTTSSFDKSVSPWTDPTAITGYVQSVEADVALAISLLEDEHDATYPKTTITQITS